MFVLRAERLPTTYEKNVKRTRHVKTNQVTHNRIFIHTLTPPPTCNLAAFDLDGSFVAHVFIFKYNLKDALVLSISTHVYQSLWCRSNSSAPDKIAAILQAIFLSAFSLMKSVVFWWKFHWSLFPRVQLMITQHWSRNWLGAEGDKSLSEPMLTQFIDRYICSSRGDELRERTIHFELNCILYFWL